MKNNLTFQLKDVHRNYLATKKIAYKTVNDFNNSSNQSFLECTHLKTMELR